ncbi:MAG TPA: DUF885 domain-containing protein [Acidobacteriaceae bacterium]
MNLKWIAIPLLGSAVVTSHLLLAKTPAQDSPDTAGIQFRSLADQYFDQVYFKYSPTTATLDGFHQYDTQLENYTRAGINEEIAALKQYEAKFASISPGSLDLNTQGDLALVVGNIRSSLLTLETIRPWEKNPDTYSSGITESAFALMERTFASPDERLRSLIARERQMPAVFTAARQNLNNPPRIYTEIALEQLPGIISFFQSDVPQAFDKAQSLQLRAQFAQTNASVLTALDAYQSWLKDNLLARSHGDFRFGSDTYRKKLLFDEMVDTPLAKLLDIANADLKKNQAEFDRLGKEIAPDKQPREVLAELEKDHPDPSQLLQTFRDTFKGLIQFIQTKHIVDIPSPVQPIVKETPPFMRATTVASMDTPGPYEKVAKEAYFNVTLPAPGDTPEQIAGRMAGFNRGTIISTSVHEAYPGHYIQFLWLQQAPSKVRKLLGASSNAEGWAHYCEQMMLDQGYGQQGTGARDTRDAKMIRLGQLQDALLRDARFVVGIQMHTGHMSYDQAVDFFAKEGYQSHESGVIETKRGTSDATYLYYTLGKLEILKLRADLEQQQGANFSLEQFHNDFLKQGYPPIKIVRRALLGNDSPAL